MESSRPKTEKRKTPLSHIEKASAPLKPIVYIKGEKPVVPNVSNDVNALKTKFSQPEKPSLRGVDTRHIINGVLGGWIGNKAVNISISERDTVAGFNGQVGPSTINLNQSRHGNSWSVTGTLNTPVGIKEVNLHVTGPQGSRHLNGWIGQEHFYVNEISPRGDEIDLNGRYFRWNVHLHYSNERGSISLKGYLKSSVESETLKIELSGTQSPAEIHISYLGVLPAVILAE